MSEANALLPKLDSLPHEEIALLLRGLGLQLMSDLLSRRRPEIVRHIGDEDERLFKSLESRSTSPGEPYARAVEDAVRGRISLASWEEKAVWDLRRLLGLVGGYSVPDALWSVLGKRAWLDLQFRQQIAAQLERYLRERVVFALEGQIEQPILDLDPSTFWFLIALTRSFSEGSPRAGSFGLWQQSDAAHRVVRSLQSVGERISLEGKWAGLWEQWVLIKAAESWSVSRQRTTLVRSIRNLPLARSGSAKRPSTEGPSEPEKVCIAKPHWEREMPVWFIPWWAVGSAAEVSSQGG